MIDQEIEELRAEPRGLYKSPHVHRGGNINIPLDDNSMFISVRGVSKESVLEMQQMSNMFS